jgi:hypothetical protein
VTPIKIDANRKNSKRSTGPRIERGKSIAKFNGMTLGLFAKHTRIDRIGLAALSQRLREAPSATRIHRADFHLGDSLWVRRRAYIVMSCFARCRPRPMPTTTSIVCRDFFLTAPEIAPPPASGRYGAYGGFSPEFVDDVEAKRTIFIIMSL